jgi:hypothetical protein
LTGYAPGIRLSKVDTLKEDFSSQSSNLHPIGLKREKKLAFLLE